MSIQKYYEMDVYEQVKLGLWAGDCSYLARNGVFAAVISHHAFVVNWIQHKSEVLLNYVMFRPMADEEIKEYAIEVRLLDKKVFPRDVKFLEDHGATFLKDSDYHKLLYGVLLEIGT